MTSKLLSLQCLHSPREGSTSSTGGREGGQSPLSLHLYSNTSPTMDREFSPSSDRQSHSPGSSSAESGVVSASEDPEYEVAESWVTCGGWGREARDRGEGRSRARVSCREESIVCAMGCGAVINSSEQEHHNVTACNKRNVPCIHCRTHMEVGLLGEHQSVCGYRYVECVACGVRLARNRLELHKRECRGEEEECPHAGAGCRWRGGPGGLERHLVTAVSSHLALVTAQCSLQAEEIERLRSKLEQATVSRDGVLVWRVGDLQARMEESRTNQGLELVSRQFYTGSPGYRLQASLFLNGNGAGAGTHVSLYIKVLPGEHDSILKWPFKHTISFTLLDQNTERTQAVNILECFLPDPTWDNFRRPSTEEESRDQLGFGFPKFVSHNMLWRRDYVKDDTMFLKIRADPKKGICV